MVMRLPVQLLAQPFEVFMAGLALASGATSLAGRSSPSAIDAQLPAGVTYLWAAMLCVGGTLTLVGLIGRSSVSWRRERAGLRLMAPAALVYGVTLIGYFGPRAIYPGGITLAFGAACALRAFVVTLDAELQARVREEDAEDEGG